MEFKDLMALVRAGYTKEDITGLLGSSLPAAETAAETTTSQAAAPAVEPAAPAEPAPAAPAAPVVDNSEVLAAIKALTTTIQKNAIMRDSIPQQTEESAVDILGKIINPTGK